MKILGIIVGIHALLAGCGFLLAGVVSLAVPSNEEIQEQRREFEAQLKKGLLHYTMFYLRHLILHDVKWIYSAISHWPQRRESRRLIYVGIACMAVAAVVGYFLEVFKG